MTAVMSTQPVEPLLGVHKLFIGGENVEGHGEPIEVLNPATAEPIATVHCADADDIDRAVRVARDAFDAGAWRGLSIHQRARILNRFADLIESRLEDLCRLEAVNNGRPITETKAQITRLPEWYRYNAALLLADRDSVVPMSGPYHSYTLNRPGFRGGSVSWIRPR